MTNSIPINRQGVDRRSLERTIGVLRAGGSLLLFPEGTRSINGELGKAMPGAGMIASRGGARCVPVFIQGSDRAMGQGAIWVRPVKIRIAFGEVFDLPERKESLSNKQYYQQCSDEMMRRIARLRMELDNDAA